MLSLFKNSLRTGSRVNFKFNNVHTKVEPPSIITSTTIAQLYGVLGPQGMSRVVIACISGRGGVQGGMQGLRNKLREQLAPFGVPDNNIFTRSWNHGEGDEDPAGAPNIQDLKNEIFNRTSQPSYVGLIGHSYGGWAVAKLSRNLKLYHNITPNFVGLVDPVFGAANSMGTDDYPRGSVIKNWWQNNGITNIDVCTGLRSPCSRGGGGISCGYPNVEGAENIHVNYFYDWDGNRERESCPQGHVHIPAVHVNMDQNKWIWRQVCDQISSNLREYSVVNLSPRFRAVDTYRRARMSNFGAAFPNFQQADYGSGVVYGVQFLKSEGVEWRDVPASVLGNPADDAARFRAVDAYAQREGFLCGFPNFHQGDYNDGQGTRYGVLLIKRGFAEWRDVRASELGNPGSNEERLLAVDRYVGSDQNRATFGAAFPNFHARDYGDGQGVRYGVWLIKKSIVQHKDVPVKELEDVIMSLTAPEISNNTQSIADITAPKLSPR